MEHVDMEAALKEAWAARKHATDTRTYHARTTVKGSIQREEDIAHALTRLRRAMVPLRSWRGKATFMTQSQTNLDLLDRVRQASDAIQSERRKLWKMQKRKKS